MKFILTWRRYRGKRVLHYYAQGKDKHYKEWRTPCGRYRITWRNQFDGTTVDPGFYPCVRGALDCNLTWDRLQPSQYKLNRTLKAAQKLCELHFRAHYPREAGALMGTCGTAGCRKAPVDGDFCKIHQGVKPKKKRKAPKKACPDCRTSWGTRKQECTCGHVFERAK